MRLSAVYGFIKTGELLFDFSNDAVFVDREEQVGKELILNQNFYN